MPIELTETGLFGKSDRQAATADTERVSDNAACEGAISSFRVVAEHIPTPPPPPGSTSG